MAAVRKNLLQTTLGYLIKGKENKREVLLAMKKRSFGKGLWNGSGGKPKSRESLRRCLLREMAEELGVKINLKETKQVALFHFYFPKPKSDWNQDVHVFMVKKWHGIPHETEEMKPKWFKIGSLPYKKMWPDDTLWFPLVLSGQTLEASFRFKNNGQIGSYIIEPWSNKLR